MQVELQRPVAEDLAVHQVRHLPGGRCHAAHAEAEASPNGIGLVKLMGRHSGFIACYAALAMSDTNFVLIPEVPFELEGTGGFLNVLRQRLETRGHAVIVAAEGAGQNLMTGRCSTDASGNAKLQDIGVYLKQRLTEYFASIGMECNLKYIGSPCGGIGDARVRRVGTGSKRWWMAADSGPSRGFSVP